MRGGSPQLGREGTNCIFGFSLKRSSLPLPLPLFFCPVGALEVAGCDVLAGGPGGGDGGGLGGAGDDVLAPCHGGAGGSLRYYSGTTSSHV